MNSQQAIRAKEAYQVLFYRHDEAGRTLGAASGLLAVLEQLLSVPAAEGVLQLNTLSKKYDKESLSKELLGEIFDSCISFGVLPESFAGGVMTAEAEFLLKHAAELLKFLRNYTATLPDDVKRKVFPRALTLFSAFPESFESNDWEKLLAPADPFANGRVFCFREKRFVPVVPSSIKPVNKFFGFPGVRRSFAEHFSDFGSGKSNLPLLVNSLPGYGKTSMVISFALAKSDAVVILADPEALEKSWREMVDALAARKDHRFVLFFDDIDPRQVNWYNFRTNVGGAFTPPENIMPVLTANYEFPPSILSRGRKISYPVFDEERCSEMIEDFLLSFGMKQPPRNIVSLMGAEYTEEFGQKRFTELSPRTLMRYLAQYENDRRKRSQVVDLAAGKMITKPDGELFYEFNIGLMRSLYGEEYIQKLLKERLREL